MKVPDILRPTLSFRKYLLANRILKTISNPTAWLCDDDGNEDPLKRIHKIEFSRFDFQMLIKEYDNLSPMRILEAIDILKENGHIEERQRDDLLYFGIFCTVKGERAYYSGYYIKKVFLFWMIIIGSPMTIIGIIKSISGLIEWLQ